MNDYKQTELEIEVAKENLLEICKQYDVPCAIYLGEVLVTIIQDVPMFTDTDDCWPEVVACNIPVKDIEKYVRSQGIENYHILIQTERIKND
jgi:hypothetical protein